MPGTLSAHFLLFLLFSADLLSPFFFRLRGFGFDWVGFNRDGRDGCCSIDLEKREAGWSGFHTKFLASRQTPITRGKFFSHRMRKKSARALNIFPINQIYYQRAPSCFCEASKDQVKNVKAILICFEALSGLKVDFFKSR